MDTIKLISYRAETSMASVLREVMTRSDDTRALLRQIYNTEADLFPDAESKTLTVVYTISRKRFTTRRSAISATNSTPPRRFFQVWIYA